MPDVLSQSEVDALLNAAGTGVEIENQGPAAAAPVPEDGAPTFEVYDFKRPERVSTDQIRSIEMMHEALARKLGASLSAYLRTIVDVKLASVEQLTYHEFLMSLPNPTCFNLLQCEPLDGSMVLEINPSIVYPIIDKLLGGGATGTPPIPEREMSDIEWRLIGHLTQETTTFLRESWTPIMDIDFKVAGRDTNPMLMQIVPPNEVVILICFEIKMGESSGMLNLCIPFPVIEPKIDEFSTIQTWFQTRRTSDRAYETKKLNEGIHDAPLKTVVYLAKTRMSMKQLLHLKPGDILLTTKDVTDPLLLKIENRAKFWVTAGQNRHFKAAQLLRPADIDDDL
jgi:flagellar motor switch protein FliM